MTDRTAGSADSRGTGPADGTDPAGGQNGPPAGVAFEFGDGELSAAVVRTLTQLTEAEVAEQLAAGDPTLWGTDAKQEAAIRLGWLTLPESSRALLPELERLSAAARESGLDHVVLAGMGGSSLAPEVITKTAGVDLTVLDTTDPGQIRRALDDRLARTVVIVASKSGSTVETDSHRRAYERAFRDAGVSQDELRRHFVVVTDPGTSLEQYARDAGYRVVTADPNVGGRYSALSAFGLVPSALAGADVVDLLDAASELRPFLAKPEDNPGLLLGAVLGAAATQLNKDKVVIADGGSGLVGFGDWAEQLIAESTGKEGTGLLPVVVEVPGAPGWTGAGEDALRVLLTGPGDLQRLSPIEGALVEVAGPPGLGPPAPIVAGPPSDLVPPGTHHEEADIRVHGTLGAQFLLWEYAVAVAGRVLGINPFDQPNVAESKQNTETLLRESGDGPLPEGDPVFEDDTVTVYAPGVGAIPMARSRRLADIVDTLLTEMPVHGYLAVMAYLDRFADADAVRLRAALAERAEDAQVTFGWGPRFLHSTGQYHKGGPQVGVFLQITGAIGDDADVPGKPYTFGRLQLAQALGDLRALASRGRPVVRVHLKDREAGLRTLLEATQA